MPPKTAQKPSTKAEAKAKQKILDDKTFGLKNKNKSSKVNKYISTLETNLKQGNRKKEDDQAKLLKEKKKQEEAKKAELAALFKPVVQQQKVALGVDPKSVVCAFFKSGLCQKGDKCKFSHDLAVERKSAKINMYEDNRGEDAAKSDDLMENWDEKKLAEVVIKKHGPGIKTTTELVCKHFLEAIETRKYGWFWECPNGNEKCKYRHALPPDFVLKSATANRKDGGEEEEQISLEEFLETERYKIHKSTPVTAESFAQWKAERKLRQEQEEKTKEKNKEADIKAGKLLNISGRDLFTYNPDAFLDDADSDNEDTFDQYLKERKDDSVDSSMEEEQIDNVQDESLFLDEDLENLEIDE